MEQARLHLIRSTTVKRVSISIIQMKDFGARASTLLSTVIIRICMLLFLQMATNKCSWQMSL